MDGSLWLLFALNLADIALTKYLVDRGAFELNPIIRHLLAIDFAWAFLFKVSMVGLFIAVAKRALEESKAVRMAINAANAIFALLVVYQIVGVLYLS